MNLNPPLALTFDDIQLIPRFSDIDSRDQIQLDTRVSKSYNIKIPILSAPMDRVTGPKMVEVLGKMGGLGCLNRFSSSITDTIDSIEFEDQLCCISIGVKDVMNSIQTLLNLEQSHKISKLPEIILIDVAHGNTHLVRDTIKMIKDHLPSDVIAGNIVTLDGACNLIKWGADALRVGIGNGSMCTTRIQTGMGYPQASAIFEIYTGIGNEIPIIADGGIRTSGDIAKALALGADSVMIGSLFAGTDESPGNVIKIGMSPNETLHKEYRGSASRSAKEDSNKGDARYIEGESKFVPYKGSVEPIVNQILEGLRSSMSYVGAKNLDEFRTNVDFVRVTQAGQFEAQPHLMFNK